MMKALITGASTGIGKEMAVYLSELGYDIYVVARRDDKLIELKKIVKTKVNIFVYDLSIMDNCYKLYECLKDEKIDIIINNAGFGTYGNYKDDNLDKELNMIDLNIKSLHILTKLFINNKYTKRILNVSSSAGLMKGGPLMGAYYGTKSYVCSYSFALFEELKRNNSDIKISVLCPGPVDTYFNKRAKVKFNLKSLSARYVARYAIDMMFKNKLIIIPGLYVKLGIFFSRFIPTKMMLKISYNIQKRKS
jgi:short-subunit dehydrogenase